ncbi:MAG: hypothetical protein JXR69_11220 [Candidatus Delongbacteria bacterium]|nr:hypothetical protein [Candidatus Delongbacteria bacterium]
MNEHEKQSIDHIKDIMERSSTFISLSGLSGVVSGILAIIGVFVLYTTFDSLFLTEEMLLSLERERTFLKNLSIVFITIFLLSVIFAFIMSYVKAKRTKDSIFNSSSKRFAFNLFIPVLAAVFVIISLIQNQTFWLIIPATLIFYGLALLSAGRYSRPEILHLGIGCLLSGILSMYFVEFSFILWGIGFGILNILTGISMYIKYDRKVK